MKSAIVTGGGTGIGAATAIALRDAGHLVVAVGLDRTDELPGDIRFEKVDLGSQESVSTFFAEFSKISALVNCAGIMRHDLEWQTEQFSAVMDVNVTAVLGCSAAAKPGLAAAGGSIVNIASMWSFFGSAGAPAYAASKGAVVALTRSLAVAFAPAGIRVNAVAPGWIETQLSVKAKTDPDRSRRINDRIPAGRWGQPDDVAKVIRFLISQDAAYVTGTILPVDGGYSIA